MEVKLTKLYLDLVGQQIEQRGPFMLQAYELRNELLDPSNDIHELLTWIDTRPLTAFEKYLRLAAHRALITH